jgi:hypothetical protein
MIRKIGKWENVTQWNRQTMQCWKRTMDEYGSQVWVSEYPDGHWDVLVDHFTKAGPSMWKHSGPHDIKPANLEEALATALVLYRMEA